MNAKTEIKLKHDWHELIRLAQGEEMIVERVRVVRSGVSIEGEFELPPLFRLTPDDQIFVAAFIRCHGSIKDMEQLLGVSYPTVKNRLNRIGKILSFIEIDFQPGSNDILDRLAQGEITVEEAEKLLRRPHDADDA